MDAKAALGVVGAGRRCAEGAGRWQRQKLVAAMLALLACARLKEQHSARGIERGSVWRQQGAVAGVRCASQWRFRRAHAGAVRVLFDHCCCGPEGLLRL